MAPATITTRLTHVRTGPANEYFHHPQLLQQKFFQNGPGSAAGYKQTMENVAQQVHKWIEGGADYDFLYCGEMLTHARTHARMHARTHTRTETPFRACMPQTMHNCMQVRSMLNMWSSTVRTT